MLTQKQVARFQTGAVLVAVYQNQDGQTGREYVDVVIYRRVKTEFRRGANLKPEDLPILTDLLVRAAGYIRGLPGTTTASAVPATVVS